MLRCTSVWHGGLTVPVLWREEQGWQPGASPLTSPESLCASTGRTAAQRLSPPTRAGQWGLGSSPVRLVPGVQLGSAVVWTGLIFRGIQTFTFFQWAKQAQKIHSLTCHLSPVARCGQRRLMICSEKMLHLSWTKKPRVTFSSLKGRGTIWEACAQSLEKFEPWKQNLNFGYPLQMVLYKLTCGGARALGRAQGIGNGIT